MQKKSMTTITTIEKALTIEFDSEKWKNNEEYMDVAMEIIGIMKIHTIIF